MTDQRAEIYQRNADDQHAKLQFAKQRQSLIRIISSYLVFGVLAIIFVALTGTISPLAAAVVVAILILVSIGMSFWQKRLQQTINHARHLIRINQAGIARRARAWDALANRPLDDSSALSPIAIDLNLFGLSSLMKLLCTAETATGHQRLATWLMGPASAAEIGQRQAISARLAAELTWRQHFQYLGMTLAKFQDQTDFLLSWTTQTSFELPRLVRGYIRASPWLLVGTLALGLINPSAFTIAFAAILAVNIPLTIIYSGSVHSLFRKLRADPRTHSFDYLSSAFAHVAASEVLQELMPEVVSMSEQAGQSLVRIERIVRAESISTNPWTMLYFYIPLQFVFLWDQQAYVRACQWKALTREQIDHWFEMLGEIEALCSLGSLEFEHPDWRHPTIDESGVEFVAKNLGHPLLSDQERVGNDISIGPRGTMMLITGSNMGGKSTLLRAIGTNAILAQMGAVCCCQQLEMPTVRVMTSMMVSDSLNDSKSLFMAQLLNVRHIIDQIDDGDGRPALYLFDEILNGTNTTDRRVTVDKLIGHLTARNAIGAMTTHDLEIASESPHKDNFDTYYLGHRLSDDEANPVISYDYTLRQGVAPSSNALLLLKILGLD